MFDRNKSVEYAESWALRYNPSFYNFTDIGGDCTNFISQCLYFGGIMMNYSTYGWYYRSLNERAPAWTGVNEFWNFGIQNIGLGIIIRECNIRDLEIADVIQLGNEDRFYHTLIVSSLSDGIRVCSHDRNARNIPLSAFSYYRLRCGKIMNV